jgi:hypothetical protein
VFIFSLLVVAVKVNIELPHEVQGQALSDKLRRIDVLGSLTLVGTIGCLLLGFNLKTTEELPWSHPLIYGLFIGCFILMTLFIFVERYWAPYPVMPLRLMTQRTTLAVAISNLLTSMTAFSMVCHFHFVPGDALLKYFHSKLYNVPLVNTPFLGPQFLLDVVLQYFSAVRLESAAQSGLNSLQFRCYGLADDVPSLLCRPAFVTALCKLVSATLVNTVHDYWQIAISFGSVLSGWSVFPIRIKHSSETWRHLINLLLGSCGEPESSTHSLWFHPS